MDDEARETRREYIIGCANTFTMLAAVVAATVALGVGMTYGVSAVQASEKLTQREKMDGIAAVMAATFIGAGAIGIGGLTITGPFRYRRKAPRTPTGP